MLKLNDNNIFVGQIKQLLATFNLPLCQVGKDYPSAGKHFIDRNAIYSWDSNLKEKFCSEYVYGRNYENITANFKIQNLLYDKPTHRYLGKYLRFLRDYKDLDLMSMYNCFDQEFNNHEIEFSLADKSNISFTNNTQSFYVFKNPIALTQLTISTHSMFQVEVCLIIDNDNQEYKDLNNQLAKVTYLKTKQNTEFYYDPKACIEEAKTGIQNEREYKELINFVNKHIDELTILIKVPRSLNRSVVVLEGKYTSKPNIQKLFVYKPEAQDSDITCISSDIIYSQLLSFENNSMNYLIADRLFEYLTHNVITGLSEPYEIKRIQLFLDKFRNSAKNINNKIIRKNVPADRYYGIWHYSDLQDLKALQNHFLLNDKEIDKTDYNIFDMLGYLDKDFEKRIQEDLDNAIV